MNSLKATRASTRITGLAILMMASAALLPTTPQAQASEAIYAYDVYYGHNGQWVHWQSYLNPNDATVALQWLAANYPQLPRTWVKRFYAWGGADLSGSWKIAPSAKTAFGSGFTGTKAFQLARTGADVYMIPGGYYRSQIRFEGSTVRFFNEAGASGAVGRFEMAGGTVQRITWSDGSVWFR